MEKPNTVPVHNCQSVYVLCDDGNRRRTMACYISSEDTNDDGTITWPSTGTCEKTNLTYSDRGKFRENLEK